MDIKNSKGETLDAGDVILEAKMFLSSLAEHYWHKGIDMEKEAMERYHEKYHAIHKVMDGLDAIYNEVNKE